MAQNQRFKGHMPATAANVHPGNFPVGSPASRAAARRLIEDRRSEAKLVDMVLLVQGLAKPNFSAWKRNENGSYTRRSRIPAGVSFEDAERMAGLAPVQARGEYVRFIIDDNIRTEPSDKTVRPAF